MTEAEAQAKQLDSVTDRVEEQEVDINKAQQAMSALVAAEQKASEASGVAVSADDVKIICDELEVTEELATQTLRDVEATKKEGESNLSAALRKLVTT